VAVDDWYDISRRSLLFDGNGNGNGNGYGNGYGNGDGDGNIGGGRPSYPKFRPL